jgi:F-type H+-transporting ATPase subunit b
MFDESFWVALAFLVFVAFIFYVKLPGLIATALDERADRIRHDLDEASRMREEAHALFAEYQRKQRSALREAADIVAQAELEAQRTAAAAEADLQASLARHSALAQAKIAQAEAAAIKAVRDIAADVAIAAARQVLVGQVIGPMATALVDRAIADLQQKLH